MAIAVKPNDRQDLPEPQNNRSLTPSDQLLGIFAVNFIIVSWVAIAFLAWYDSYPHIPPWMYGSQTAILVLSFALATFDSWWPRVRDLGLGPEGDPVSVNANIVVLKIAVLGLTLLNIFVLWRLAEETGGVISPFAPFLTAPAVFAPFVTKNWKTIIALSLLVTLAIGLSDKTDTLSLEGIWPYKGTAAVMVLLAGVLTALRMRVAKKGSPLTGEGSEPENPSSGNGGKPAA
jgi:hypothetical protein